MVCPAGGYAINSIFDYLGLPTVGQVASGATVSHSALPLRAYNLIYNEWFRDQNLINSATVPTGDGPDTVSDYTLRRRGKRHDYFTSCLPWPQKGQAVSLPLGSSATVRVSPTELVTSGGQATMKMRQASNGTYPGANVSIGLDTGGQTIGLTGAVTGAGNSFYPTNLYADLSTATAATINAIRLAFQVQRLLERDARGGTRYTELVLSHLGVS